MGAALILLAPSPALSAYWPGFAPWVSTDSSRTYGLTPETARPGYLAFTPTLASQTSSELQSWVVRIAGDSGTTIRNFAGTSIGTWNQLAQHDYSLKGSPWSINEAWYWIENPTGTGCGGPYNGNAVLLDGQTYQPIKSVSTITGDSRWRSDPTKPWERLVGSGSTLRRIDVRDLSTVATYTLAATVDGIGVGEGNESWDSRWVAMVLKFGSGGGGTIQIVDMIRNRVGIPIKVPLGPVGADSSDDVKISAWGNYVVVSYDDTWNGCRRVFSVDTTNCKLTDANDDKIADVYAVNTASEFCAGPSNTCPTCTAAQGYIYPLEHADMAYNPYSIERAEVMIGVGQCTSPKDSGQVVMVRLRDGAVRHISVGTVGNIDFKAEAYPGHLTAQCRLRPGWVYCDYTCVTNSDSTGEARFQNEVVAWRLPSDSTVAAHPKAGQRFGWKHNTGEGCGPTCETAQGQAAVSPTGTRVVYHSNWRVGVSPGTTLNNWRRDYVIDARGVDARVAGVGPRVIFCSPRGSDRNSGEDSSATGAWASLGKALAAAGPGVKVQLQGGVHRSPDRFEPAFGGFGAGGDSAFKLVGDLPIDAAESASRTDLYGDGGNVTLRSGLDTLRVRWPFVNISGVKFDSSGTQNGVVAFQRFENYGTVVCAVPGITKRAYADSLTFSTVGAISFEGASSCVARRDSITNKDSKAANHGLISLRARGGWNSDQNLIRRCKGTALVRENARLFADSASNFLSSSQNTVDSCEFRITLTPGASPAGGSHGTVALWSRAGGAILGDSRIVANPSTAIDTIYWTGITLRDSCNSLSFKRDTLDFGVKVGSSSPTTARNVASDWSANGYTTSLEVDSCFIRTCDSFRNTGELELGNFQHNVWLGTDCAPLVIGPGELDRTTVKFNTFAGMGSYALDLQAQVIRATSPMVANLLYRNTATNADSAVENITLPGSFANWQVQHEWNLFHSSTDSCRYAVRFQPSTSSAPRPFCGSYCTTGPGSPCWFDVKQCDSFSAWASPSFKVIPTPAKSDSFEFFYGAVFCGTGASWIYPGAMAVGGRQPARNNPPGTITKMIQTGSSSGSVSLRWPNVSDDGSSNEAVFYYDTRYSETPPPTAGGVYAVNDAWWDVASFATGPTPAAPLDGNGAVQNANVTVSGLTADHKYYFAVRPINTCLVLGSYSNVICAYASASLTCD